MTPTEYPCILLEVASNGCASAVLLLARDDLFSMAELAYFQDNGHESEAEPRDESQALDWLRDNLANSQLLTIAAARAIVADNATTRAVRDALAIYDGAPPSYRTAPAPARRSNRLPNWVLGLAGALAITGLVAALCGAPREFYIPCLLLSAPVVGLGAWLDRPERTSP